ncbi:MAG: glycosyltransferase family 2 protein [Thomasclavelia sp.]
MNKIEISVVIPTFNRALLVCDAVDSVLNQTYINYIKEVIIVDDGSTDNTEEVVKEKYSNNDIVKYYKKINGGVSSARNYGMSVAEGNWIALLDSDDEWLEDKIKFQVETIIKHNNIDFIGTDYDDCCLKIGLKKINSLYKANIKDLCIKFFPVTPSMLFKKVIYQEIGGFNELQKYAEDGEFCLRICEKYNYYHLPISLVKIGHGKRSFGDSSGLSGNLKGMYLGNISNIKQLKKRKIISKRFYLFLRIFYYFKYLRRIIIVMINN